MVRTVAFQAINRSSILRSATKFKSLSNAWTFKFVLSESAAGRRVEGLQTTGHVPISPFLEPKHTKLAIKGKTGTQHTIFLCWVLKWFQI